jgi:hypothetical protein
MRIIGISGYSRSGKSSVVDYLNKKYNYKVISTSEWLTYRTLDYFKLCPSQKNIDAFTLKNQDDSYLDLFGMTPRNMKIWVAEEHLVPTKGRYYGIVVPALKDSDIDPKNDSNIVIEIFNKEELNLINRYLWMKFQTCVELTINIRRDSEIVGCDKRDLPGEITFTNNKTIEQLAEQIHELAFAMI